MLGSGTIKFKIIGRHICFQTLTCPQLQTADDKLTGVEFAPIKGNIETVECCAMINLNEEAIDKNTFQGQSYDLYTVSIHFKMPYTK